MVYCGEQVILMINMQVPCRETAGFANNKGVTQTGGIGSLFSTFILCYLHNMRRVVRKPDFCICENKDADQLRGNREADQRLCFCLRIAQSLYYLNPKFQASNYLLWLYSLVCVGPGRKPRRPVFSQRGSYDIKLNVVSLASLCYSC